MRKLITIALVSIVLAITLLVAYARPHSLSSGAASSALVEPTSRVADAVAQTPKNSDDVVTDSSNIALQPEAVKLRRRIGGERFNAKPSLVLVQGTLDIGTERQHVQISRRHDAHGEDVEVSFSGAPSKLSWSKNSGARNANSRLNGAERALLERLTFDSADQFILAQLRGASYQVVTRNLRPDDAPDNYDGPLWDVIRLDDPEPDEQKRPLSTWRLYYLNNTTGLIDKIVYEADGQRVEARFIEWTERSGEKFPSQIVWATQAQTLMTFTLINVSFIAQ